MVSFCGFSLCAQDEFFQRCDLSHDEYGHQTHQGDRDKMSDLKFWIHIASYKPTIIFFKKGILKTSKIRTKEIRVKTNMPLSSSLMLSE